MAVGVWGVSSIRAVRIHPSPATPRLLSMREMRGRALSVTVVIPEKGGHGLTMQRHCGIAEGLGQ